MSLLIAEAQRGTSLARRLTRVAEAITELNYRPNQVARALHGKSTHTIGVIVPTVALPFFGEMAAEIENALMSHPDVVGAAAIGQPDSFAGELPCVYVLLREGATATEEDLAAHARAHIHERAAVPKHIEIMSELPKTAVGKVFKPELRKMAIKRVYDAALDGCGSHVVEVADDKKRGLVAKLSRDPGCDEAAVKQRLGSFTRPWDWS